MAIVARMIKKFYDFEFGLFCDSTGLVPNFGSKSEMVSYALLNWYLQ